MSRWDSDHQEYRIPRQDPCTSLEAAETGTKPVHGAAAVREVVLSILTVLEAQQPFMKHMGLEIQLVPEMNKILKATCNLNKLSLNASQLPLGHPSGHSRTKVTDWDQGN